MATEEKNKIGRPSLLTKELIEKALFYLANDGWQEAGDVVPSVAGLACYLGVGRQTLYDYKEQSLEFSYILEGIGAAQEKMLINGGLLSTYNPTITKMMMTKHGYTDKHEVDNTSSDGSLSMPVTIEIVSAESK
ncbi:DNA-packaging protein [Neisseria sp. Ec49-e6-T10]|uniref:DNA-packaging protein n=1 Tax=Neisseria sp. Ec49-e6-T10 TaxID=3140744 RepID=UPI003EBD9AFA